MKPYCVSDCFAYKDTNHIGLGLTLMTPLVLITSWKDPISKQGPILRPWGFNIWIGGVGEQQWP